MVFTEIVQDFLDLSGKLRKSAWTLMLVVRSSITCFTEIQNSKLGEKLPVEKTPGRENFKLVDNSKSGNFKVRMLDEARIGGTESLD